jgi:hypothetical protein
MNAAREALEDHAQAARTTSKAAMIARDDLSETLAEIRTAAGWVKTLAIVACLAVLGYVWSQAVEQLGHE